MRSPSTACSERQKQKLHDTTLEQIHFHEVGTLDALADVVGCALLIRTIASGSRFSRRPFTSETAL